MFGTRRVGGARVALLARCCRRCPRWLQPERHTWVNDPGLSSPRRLRRGLWTSLPGLLAPQGIPANPYGVYRLDSGDRLRVIVFGQGNLSRYYNVDTSRNVSLPLIGSVRARGLSTVQLGLDIEAKLRRKHIKDPKSASRSTPIAPSSSWAKSAGRGSIPMSMRSRAPWPLPRATPRGQEAHGAAHAQIRGPMSTVMVPTNYPVQPRDTIYVLERFF